MTDAPAPERRRPAAMQGRERLVSFVLAGVAAVLVVVAYAVAGEVDSMFLPVGLGSAALLGAGAYIRHRILAGVGAMFLYSVVWTLGFLFAIPYVALAFYLLYKLSRANSELTRAARQQRLAARRAARARTEPVVAKGKRGGRVTPPGTPPRSRRR